MKITKKNTKVTKSFRFDESTVKALKFIAKKNNCSMTTVLESLIYDKCTEIIFVKSDKNEKQEN